MDSWVGLFGWELADLYVAEGDGKAVVLKEEVAVVGFAEVGANVELAGGDDGPELGGSAVILDNLDAVQPVLAVGSADDDASGVPLAYGFDGLRFFCGNHVVEGAYGAVAVAAFFGVRVRCGDSRPNQAEGYTAFRCERSGVRHL